MKINAYQYNKLQFVHKLKLVYLRRVNLSVSVDDRPIHSAKRVCHPKLSPPPDPSSSTTTPPPRALNTLSPQASNHKLEISI